MLNQNIIDILENSSVNESAFTVTLPDEQLERSVYESVNDVLTRIGGKWNSSKKKHIFPYNPKALLQAVIDSRLLPPKNPTAFFPTPQPVLDLMMEIADSHLRSDMRFLEPSAGTGAIANTVKNWAHENDINIHIDCCEYLSVSQQVLKNDGFNVVAQDFLQYQTDDLYDLILMNPPFSVEGDSKAFITHIMHAWNLLKETGYFMAIVPPGWLTQNTQAMREFREFVCNTFSIEELGAGTFKESGTMINTLLIYGSKSDFNWRTESHNGWKSYHGWHASLLLDNEFKFQNSIQACKTKEQFNGIVLGALDEFRNKQYIPIVLNESDLDELWRYYKIPDVISAYAYDTHYSDMDVDLFEGKILDHNIFGHLPLKVVDGKVRALVTIDCDSCLRQKKTCEQPYQCYLGPGINAGAWVYAYNINTFAFEANLQDEVYCCPECKKEGMKV